MATARFRFSAVDTVTGKEITGTYDGTNRAQVTARLRAQGMVPLSVQELSQTGLHREVHLPGLSRTVPLQALELYTRQLAGLINAGLPLLRTLRVVSEQTENTQLRRATVDVQHAVETGSSLSAALALHPTIFRPLMLSLVKVGEAGGFLGRSLNSLSSIYQRENELRGKIRSASTYPLVVFVIAVIGMLLMVTFVVPIFSNMFDSLGSELPLPTRILVSLSNNMVWILPLLALLAIVGVWLWHKNRDNHAVRQAVDQTVLKVPVFGPLIRKVLVARFARNLAMLLKAGVPLTQALQTMGQTSGNLVLEDAVGDILDGVREGSSLAAETAKHEIFPATVVQMIAVGEESGSLANMLSSIAEIYDNEVNIATDQLSSTLEPILLVVVGVLIGGMVISMYLPIFSLYGEIAAS